MTSVNITYQIQISDDTVDPILSSQFNWLDKWVLYLPLMVRILPDRSARSKCCNRFVLTCTIIFVIILFPLVVFFTVAGICYEWKDSNQRTILIGTSIATLTMCIDRVFSLVYYCWKFNYPWYSKLALNNDYKYHQHHDPQYHYKQTCYIKFIAKYYIKIIKYTVIFYTLISIILYVASSAFLPLTTSDLITNIVGNLMFLLLIEYPCFFTLVIHTAICYKYYWYLSKLTNAIKNNDNGTNDANNLFFRYKVLYIHFKNDYNFHLKWCIMVYIFSWLMDIWVGSISPVYKNMKRGTWLYILSASTMSKIIVFALLYVISSSLLSETFRALQLLLWKNISKCIGDENKLNSQHILTSFVTYSTKYPIYITFVGIIMTRKNIVYFVIGFAATRAIAELLSIYY